MVMARLIWAPKFSGFEKLGVERNGDRHATTGACRPTVRWVPRRQAATLAILAEGYLLYRASTPARAWRHLRADHTPNTRWEEVLYAPC